MSDFNISFKEHIPRDTFISVIHRILLQCKPPGSLINKLAVEFPNHYHVSVAPDVGAWIQFATQRKVRDLRLRLIGEYLCLDHIYHLPRHIYGNSELRNLSLSCVQVLPDSMVGWRSLKSLTLEDLQLTDEAISLILSGSPILEFLKL